MTVFKKQVEQHDASQAKPSFWRRRPLQIGAGAVVLLAALTIGGIQYVHANTVEYYHLFRNGTEVGTVSSPDEVDALIQQKKQAVEAANPELQMVVDTGSLTYEGDSGYKADPDTEATLDKLSGMITAKASGTELYVDGKLIGIVKDQETADAILARVQTKYAPNLPANKKAGAVTTLSYSAESKAAGTKADASGKPPADGTKLNSVSFKEKVNIESAEVDPSKVMDPADVYKKLIQGSVKPTKYTVLAGDCIGCIAQKFNISKDVIYKNNPWIQNDEIDEGDVLDLTVLQPELTVKTVEDVTETVAIEPGVEIQKNGSMRAGETKVLREGASGSKKVTYQVVKENGTVVSEQVVDQQVVKEAVSKIVVKGTKVILGEGSGTFAWPVASHSISSSYGTRWGKLHKGIDITGSRTILAADDGVVTFVGTKTGYGNTIIINHKNGYETLYGHLKSFSVKKGQIVQKGDKLGIMGATGDATGVHLHFEIHKNGSLTNPLKYL
ncbi:M23 family metallopeptidase [Paenibacillus protaetiae]|nr:M23 family metallopeptidase [Paenibacillus protaetiae]